jgi:hypothetical protein
VHSTPSTTHFGLQRAREYSLIWRDVKLEVGGSVPGQPVKVILRGVSGAALPGDLVALVGPSGDPPVPATFLCPQPHLSMLPACLID